MPTLLESFEQTQSRRCEKCNSTNTYYKQTGDVRRCKRCGHETPMNREKKREVIRRIEQAVKEGKNIEKEEF